MIRQWPIMFVKLLDCQLRWQTAIIPSQKRSYRSHYVASRCIPNSTARIRSPRWRNMLNICGNCYAAHGYRVQNGADQLKIDFIAVWLTVEPTWFLGTTHIGFRLPKVMKVIWLCIRWVISCFDQQDTPEVVRSAGIHVVMNTTNSDSALLKKWLSLGDKCVKYKDDCLALAKQAEPNETLD